MQIERALVCLVCYRHCVTLHYTAPSIYTGTAPYTNFSQRPQPTCQLFQNG